MENELKVSLELALKNLEGNGIRTFVVENKAEVTNLLAKLVTKEQTIGSGGSMSLNQCGVLEFLKSNGYNYIDINQANISDEKRQELKQQAAFADVYLCSSNAVTENGELYNVDGNGNRVSAISFSAKSVVMVVGVNKLVKNLDEAVLRVKTIAAPQNCLRLNRDTYCKSFGKCKSLLKENPEMTDGCQSPQRICCQYLVSSHQRAKNRITVIFVKDELGM